MFFLNFFGKGLYYWGKVLHNKRENQSLKVRSDRTLIATQISPIFNMVILIWFLPLLFLKDSVLLVSASDVPLFSDVTREMDKKIQMIVFNDFIILTINQYLQSEQIKQYVALNLKYYIDVAKLSFQICLEIKKK